MSCGLSRIVCNFSANVEYHTSVFSELVKSVQTIDRFILKDQKILSVWFKAKLKISVSLKFASTIVQVNLKENF